MHRQFIFHNVRSESSAPIIQPTRSPSITQTRSQPPTTQTISLTQMYPHTQSQNNTTQYPERVSTLIPRIPITTYQPITIHHPITHQLQTIQPNPMSQFMQLSNQQPLIMPQNPIIQHLVPPNIRPVQYPNISPPITQPAIQDLAETNLQSCEVASWFNSNYFNVSNSRSVEQRQNIINSYKERNLNQNVLFTKNYQYKPRQVMALNNEIANEWFLLFFPYLLAHYSQEVSFELLLKHWLSHTRPGKDLMKEALADMKITESSNDSISTLLRSKFKRNISSTKIGASWISTGIAVKRYRRFKSMLSKEHRLYKKLLPPARSVEQLSSRLRKYLIEKAPYKMNKHDTWISVSDGGKYLQDCVRLWVKGSEATSLTVKHCFDFRKAVISAPTIYTTSPTGLTEKSPKPCNVRTVSIFKGTEDDALQNPEAWNSFKEGITVDSVMIDEQNVNVRHMVCPDLAAIRKTVKIDKPFRQTMNQVFLLISISLVLHIFTNHFSHETGKFEEKHDKLFDKLIARKKETVIATLKTWQQNLNQNQLSHLSHLPTMQEFVTHYKLNSTTFTTISKNLNNSICDGDEGKVVCFKCFYNWTQKKFYYAYPDIPIWNWRRTDNHWPNILGYNLKDCAVCVAHGLNRLLMTNIQLFVEKDLETMTYFCSLFGKDTPIQAMKSASDTLALLDDKYKHFLNRKEWTNNGISVKETKSNDEKNKDQTVHTELKFSQLLFKMCDKIIITIPIWWPYFKEYLDKKEENRQATVTNREVESTRNEINTIVETIQPGTKQINNRLITDTDMRDLWYLLLDVWCVVKSSRSEWIKWKADNYRYPISLFSDYKKLVFKNSGKAVGIADYVHIICDHLVEFFEEFGLAPTEYHNVDTEGIHCTQKKREDTTSMNGGCFYDEFEELWIREMKLMLCQLSTSELDERLAGL